jgi:hypothetical protein
MKISLFSVVKQALRSSGANATNKHISNVSMCAPFLLEAAKRCDKIFSVPPQSTAHTTRDSKADILKIQERLQEAGIITEDKKRNMPKFEDPTQNGLHTLCKKEWLQKHLASTENLHDEQEHFQGEIDLDYELSDIAYTFH